MKNNNFHYSTITEGTTLLESLPERITEYNSMQGDRRSLFSYKESKDNSICIRVREGAVSGGNLDFRGTISVGEDGKTRIDGEVYHDPSDGPYNIREKVYSLFIRGFARLTILLLFYGILLGISWLMPGRNFWLPAVPPLITLVVMVTRSILSAKHLPNRIDRFFVDYCGCSKE